jgi:hypothetical protein
MIITNSLIFIEMYEIMIHHKNIEKFKYINILSFLTLLI